MLKQLLLIVTLLLIIAQLSFTVSDDDIQLSLHLKQYGGQTVHLGFSYGTKVLFKDPIKLDAEGAGSYADIDHAGIYFLRMPDSSSYEFIVSQPGLYDIHSDKGVISIHGNAECEAYDNFIKSVAGQFNRIDSLKILKDDTNDQFVMNVTKMKIASCRKAIDSMTTELAYRFEGSFLGEYMKAMIPVKIRSNISGQDSSATDSTNFLTSIYQYKYHYFDHINFDDPRLVFTPILEDKIIFYLDHMVYHLPDSLIREIDNILSKSSSSEVYRFIITFLLQKFNHQKHRETGEQAYIHLVQNYYMTGKTPWIQEDEVQKLLEELTRMQSIVSGSIAPEIELPDAAGRKCSLHAIKSDLTILIFWDFSCPDCRRIMQDFITLIKKYYYIDIQVYSVYTGADPDVWKAWNFKRLPGTWINTYQDSDERASYYYNITYTPTIYILDSNKVIIRKNITLPELDEYLFQNTD